jgi:ribonuclease HII
MMALQIRKESELGVCMFAIGEATADEIDRINIRQATALAMERALQKLEQQLSSRLIESLVIDGNDHFSFESFANIKPFYIIRGDSKHRHIMAASIIAKVYRDTLLASFDSQYGGYGFVEHKGYGTKKHLSALHEL